MPDADWEIIRKHRHSTERPPERPEGVYGISMKGAALLGIHEKTGKLYWDGKEVVTKSIFSLGLFERLLATTAALGTFGTFVVHAGRAKGWWP